MDTKKDGMIPDFGNAPEIGDFRLIVGAKQIRKALGKGTARCVFLAKNADPAITDPIAAQCNDLGLPLYWVTTMDALGKRCGIDVGATAAAAVE